MQRTGSLPCAMWLGCSWWGACSMNTHTLHTLQVVKLQLAGRVLDEQTLEATYTQSELKDLWKPVMLSPGAVSPSLAHLGSADLETSWVGPLVNGECKGWLISAEDHQMLLEDTEVRVTLVTAAHATAHGACHGARHGACHGTLREHLLSCDARNARNGRNARNAHNTRYARYARDARNAHHARNVPTGATLGAREGGRGQRVRARRQQPLSGGSCLRDVLTAPCRYSVLKPRAALQEAGLRRGHNAAARRADCDAAGWARCAAEPEGGPYPQWHARRGTARAGAMAGHAMGAAGGCSARAHA